jgi:hypothetical protein
MFASNVEGTQKLRNTKENGSPMRAALFYILCFYPK